ncbi:MAG TPA: N-acyl homoserine lactonase family protein [Stellaceae bacterium]|nr:N-acyl homoserine lactonase family protein [Stellaceae bacterium]
MPNATPEYEVYALRYAHAPQSAIRNFLLAPNPHDAPVPMDFYVWAIRSDKHTIVVDTGFNAEAARRRRPEWKVLQSPDAALKRIGIDAATASDVVLTHLDWDHSGNTGFFPKATLHLQDAEMAFRTGRYMTHEFYSARAEIDDVIATLRRVYGGTVRFHDGTGEIAPGVTLHLVGGHTAGMQVVRVPTARGWIVLASDAAHYWSNLRQRHPFPLVLDVGKMLEGFRLMEQLADGPDHIIPGHDPAVVQRFPALPDVPDIVRLDRPPAR